MAEKIYTAISGSVTKIRAEQIKAEDNDLVTLAGELFAIKGQITDIIGGATYKEEAPANVQMKDLDVHLNASSMTELIVKLDSVMSGAVQMNSTLNVDGEATLASAIVEDLTQGQVVLAGAAGALEGSANLTFDGTDLVMASAKVSDLTDGRVVFAGVNGALVDDADFSYDGSVVSMPSAKVADLTAGRVVYAGVSGSLVDDADMTFDGDILTVKGSKFGYNVEIVGDLTVKGTTTQVDTVNLLVADAKIVISSGSVVDGAGIYLADESAGENIRWSVASGSWIASDAFAADELWALDLTDVFVRANSDHKLVAASASDIGTAVSGALAAGTGVTLSYSADKTTIAIGQPVETSSQVQFAAVSGSIVANGLTTGQLVKNTNGLLVDADINDFISAGTGVSIDSNGVIAIGQAVGTTDAVTFGKVSLDGADAYVDGGSGYLELGFLGGSITVAQSGSVALSGFSASSIIGALNELKSTASAASKKAIAEIASAQSAGADVLSLLSSDFISELDSANGMVFVNGQLMLSGALGSKDYTVDGGVLKFTFGLEIGDVVVVQKA